MNRFSSFLLFQFSFNSHPLISSFLSFPPVLSFSSCRARRVCWTWWWRTPCSPPGKHLSWAANRGGATSPVPVDTRSRPPPPSLRRSCLLQLPPPPAAPPLQRASGRVWRRKSPAMLVGRGNGPGAPPGLCTTTFITTRPGALICTGTLRRSHPSPKWIPVTSRRTPAIGTASTQGMVLHPGRDHLHHRPPALGSQCPTQGWSFVAGRRGSACPARENLEGGASVEVEAYQGWSLWTYHSQGRKHPCWTLLRLMGTSLMASRAIRTHALADANSACRSCILGTRTCWEGACWRPKALRLQLTLTHTHTHTHTYSYPSRVPLANCFSICAQYTKHGCMALFNQIPVSFTSGKSLQLLPALFLGWILNVAVCLSYSKASPPDPR